MRVTKKTLDALAVTLSNVTGKDIHVSGAYNGYCLMVVGEHNGASYLCSNGHVTARTVYDEGRAYLAGYTQCRRDIESVQRIL